MDKAQALRDLALALMGEDRVDEGILIEELVAEIIKPGPFCPVCRSAMQRVKYVGYYESFTYWHCGCGEDDVPVAHEWEGRYA